METHSKNKQCHTHNNKYTYLSLHQLTISSSGLCQATGLCLALCRKAFYSVWFALCVQMQLGHRAIMANLWLFGPLVSWSVRSVHMCVVCACVSMCCEYVCMWEYVCVCVCMCMYVWMCVSIYWLCIRVFCFWVHVVYMCMHACVCVCVFDFLRSFSPFRVLSCLLIMYCFAQVPYSTSLLHCQQIGDCYCTR